MLNGDWAQKMILFFQVPEDMMITRINFTNFLWPVRTGNLVNKDAEFGFRATVSLHYNVIKVISARKLFINL
jgi:hypothetical protein